MNDASEFTGGGTYFVPLGESILPGILLIFTGSTLVLTRPCLGIGHALSFNGNIMHGGAPIVSGTRYILAVFLYAYSLLPQEGNNDLSTVFTRSKRKLSDIDSSAVDEEIGGFTFGFGAIE